MPKRSGPPQRDEIDVDLPADATAPSAARRTTRGALTRWHLPGLCAPVVLAVSELVGNAVRHGRPPVGMTLRRRDGSVRLEVRDSAPAPRHPPEAPAEDAESGRGLLIVDAVATASGLQDIVDDGKVAWAEFSSDEAAMTPDAAGPAGSPAT